MWDNRISALICTADLGADNRVAKWPALPIATTNWLAGQSERRTNSGLVFGAHSIVIAFDVAVHARPNYRLSPSEPKWFQHTNAPVGPSPPIAAQLDTQSETGPLLPTKELCVISRYSFQIRIGFRLFSCAHFCSLYLNFKQVICLVICFIQ